ncbi:MAG: exodeoxyribonuclease III [Xanthomonadales bacterium]|nr:exodeoxyribonuclease III [Xanthomonadales bacterium]NIN60323.1 exodeoxyribonuclease III [Xanthomonadales bacterium]NIN75675.1 exodeoxyribonuclease III [Xanthomonadales bacterium]NIO14748.1 exodeoxyribonuclease III [Xanthomonadales bacterium]NIP12716.1 exodeoxyribonuclease III [Xanthomonadales bacterium]
MRIVTLNANGIRAAARKGFFDWLGNQDADVVCIQETKAQVHQLQDPQFFPDGYHCYYHDAERPGYSGVALYSRHRPHAVREGLGWPVMDRDGRWLQVDYGDLSVISLYLHSGSSSEERQQLKFQAMDHLQPRLREMAADGRDYLICGDWNIAHRKIDLKNWRGNQKNSGFLPEERAWMSELFGEVGWVDAFRCVEPGEHQYTWWSNRGRAWDNNTGWRIDYQVATPGLAARTRAASIYKDQRFSDHAPLIMDYDFDLQG